MVEYKVRTNSFYFNKKTGQLMFMVQAKQLRKAMGITSGRPATHLIVEPVAAIVGFNKKEPVITNISEAEEFPEEEEEQYSVI